MLKLRDENILITQNVKSVSYNIYEAIKIVKTILGVILKSNPNDEKEIQSYPEIPYLLLNSYICSYCICS